jgi:hypothetical protein
MPSMKLGSDEEWTTVPSRTFLEPDDPFEGINSTVLDFWRYAMSDLRTNNVRGYLAEFLVARAVGAEGPRVEWDAYDVVAPDETTIEVKTSAYVQVWSQRRPSQIRFSGLASRTWSPEAGYSADATFNADVYVFAVQTAPSHDDYDVLAIDQWEFYVASREALEATGHRSLNLKSVAKIALGPLPWPALADAISQVRSSERHHGEPV